MAGSLLPNDFDIFSHKWIISVATNSEYILYLMVGNEPKPIYGFQQCIFFLVITFDGWYKINMLIYIVAIGKIDTYQNNLKIKTHTIRTRQQNITSLFYSDFNSTVKMPILVACLTTVINKYDNQGNNIKQMTRGYGNELV